MVDELRELLRASVADAPPDTAGVADVVFEGRRRVRRRRALGLAATSVAVAGVVALASAVPGALDRGADTGPADGRDDVVGPVLRLADAVPAVPGSDYRQVFAHTNQNLDQDNGQYVDGMTPDGLVVFKDGPHDVTNIPRLALVDPASGTKDWLPRAPAALGWPVELGRQQLVYATTDERGRPEIAVFDRPSRSWRLLSWPGLPGGGGFGRVELGPDGRVYVAVSQRRLSGQAPGPPSGEKVPGEEVDDSGALGEDYALWSASLADESDVRDEHLRVGDFAFTDDTLVWTRATNGVNDLVTVRDLATGEEHSFDPRSGLHCNQLGLGVTDDVVMLSQYCGDYPEGRDDRVQVLTTQGDPVVTIQDDGIEGSVASEGLVQVTAFNEEAEGDYVYDASEGRFLRLSASMSRYAMGGPTPPGYLLWAEAVNKARGSNQVLAEYPVE